MIRKSQISHINSLKIKKYRQQHKQFIAEGVKIVKEFISGSLAIDSIYATKTWLTHPDISSALSQLDKTIKIIEITEKELQRISNLETPNEVLAIINISEISLNIQSLHNGLVLMLDNISDPGNLGTIIRIADWFGINNIICSNDCVDVYNPKVVQSTMGSIARINVYYSDLEDVLSSLESSTNIYGAILNAESIYKKQLSEKGIILIGNESKGISSQITKYINNPISIPSYPDNSQTQKAESLNASIATGIICAEFRRKN